MIYGYNKNDVKRMRTKLYRVMRAALAGIWLAAGYSAVAQSAGTAQGAPIQGSAIDAGTAAPPAAATAAPKAIVIHTTDGVINADFETLAAYAFNVPDMTASNHISVSQAEKQIPAVIKGLDGKTVRIRGFMMPIKEVQGKTTQFLITRSQPTCCYSGATEINEFVTVNAPGKGFDTMMDDAITVQGTLHVGAVLDSGFIVGVYTMDAEKVIAPAN